jgi:C8 domain
MWRQYIAKSKLFIVRSVTEEYYQFRIIVPNIQRGKNGRLKNARFCIIRLRPAMALYQLKITTKCKFFYSENCLLQICLPLKMYILKSCNYDLNKTVTCFTRCIEDSCGCESGDDCHCLCSAVASYAQKCNENNIPIKWRTQETCRMVYIYLLISSLNLFHQSQQCSVTSRELSTVLA